MPTKRVGFPNTSIVATDLYVRVDGDDNNNPGTLALPLRTLEAALDRIPEFVNHLYRIHLGAHPAGSSGWLWVPFRNRSLAANIWIICDGAGVDDPFTEILSSTAALAGSGQGLVKAAALVVDAYNGHTIEILSGAAAGDRRTVLYNTATDIVPTVEFSAAVAPGDNYRIVGPAIKIDFGLAGDFSYLLENVGCAEETASPLEYVAKTYAVYFENVSLDSNVGFISFYTKNSSMVFVGGETATFTDFNLERSSLKAGYDSSPDPAYLYALQAPVADRGVATNVTWQGWGLFMYMVFNITAGHYFGAFVFDQRIIVMGPVKFYGIGVHLMQGIHHHLSTKDAYFVLYQKPWATVTIHSRCGNDGTNPCVFVSNGLYITVNAVYYGDKDGLVASDYGKILDTLSSGQVSGIAVRTRYRGQITYDHAPAITGLTGDLSSNNGRTVHDKSLLAAAGTGLFDERHGRINRNENV